MTQIVVPGQRELHLSETGQYTVFHEYKSVVGDKVYSGSLSGLQCSLTSKATGEQIPLSPSSANSTYSMGPRSGVSVFDFSVQSPGLYVFSAQYPAGEDGPEVVLAVGHGFVKQLLVTILGGLGIMFGSMGVAGTIAVLTYFKRHREFKRIQDGADAFAHPG